MAHSDNDPAPRELLTVEAAADRLAVSRTTMFALLKSGAIESVQLGRLRRIPATAIDEYIERASSPGADARTGW